MAARPCLVTERKWCGDAAERDGVDGDLDGAAGAVLEADRHGEARCELAVDLAFRGARADRAPGDEVGDELRRDRIEEFGARGQAERQHVAEEAARDAQAAVDGEASVEVGVVDETLPADGRARLLEVRAHHDAELAAVAVGERLELVRVLERGRWCRGSSRGRRRPRAGRRGRR